MKVVKGGKPVKGSKVPLDADDAKVGGVGRKRAVMLALEAASERPGANDPDDRPVRRLKAAGRGRLAAR